jgi:hypothetical protein
VAELLGSPLIIIAAAAASLLAIAVPLWRIWRIYDGAPTRRPVDASAAGLQPTPRVAERLAELAQLGFTRLGEAQLDLPGQRAVPMTPTGSVRIVGAERDRHAIFVLVDADRTITAETAEVPGAPVIVSLNSAFADSTVVETMFPRGESIHDPDFHSGHNSHSLHSAYDDQRRHVDGWRVGHGEPLTVSTMADYLRADAAHRERYAKRTLRGPMIRRQLLPAAIALLVVLAVVALTLSNWPG